MLESQSVNKLELRPQTPNTLCNSAKLNLKNILNKYLTSNIQHRFFMNVDN